MLNSIRSLSNRAGTNQDGSDATDVLDPLLLTGETVRYVLTSSKGIEQTTDGRTTTVKPDADHDAYTIVTDHRVLFLVGSDAEEPSIDIDFDLASITMAKARDSLLSSSLVVTSEQTETVKFTPSGGPDLEEVADYIDRVGSAWADLHRAVSATRSSIEAFESHLQAGEDAHEALTQARSRISNAYHHATRNEDGPVEEMLSIVEPIEDELDTLQVEARLGRVDELLEATDAQEDFDEAVQSLVEATIRLDEARDALDGVDIGDETIVETLGERADAIDDAGASLLADVEAICHRALDADDPKAASEAWQRADARYQALQTADWDEVAGVDDEALRFQQSWVVGGRIDALVARANELEAEGDELDDDGDDVTDRYERARDHVESARQIAAEHSYTDADRFDERLDDLGEKIEVSEWEWGSS